MSLIVQLFDSFIKVEYKVLEKLIVGCHLTHNKNNNSIFKCFYVSS